GGRGGVPPAPPRQSARLGQRVELVDEDDAGRLALGLREEVPHARRTHADEQLHELGAADREERHVGLARHRLRQQRLAGARRTDQEDALRQLAAEQSVLSRLLQELDDLLQLLLGLVLPRDVLERDARLLLAVHAGAALRDRHPPTAPTPPPHA